MRKGNPIQIISVYKADWDALRAERAALERKNKLLIETIERGNAAKDAEIIAMRGSNTELIKCFVETEVENIAKGERIAELEAALGPFADDKAEWLKVIKLTPGCSLMAKRMNESIDRAAAALKLGPGVEQFINDEPEFPDEMPGELLATHRDMMRRIGIKAAFECSMRAAVRATKKAMIRRLGPAPDGYKWRMCLLPVKEARG